jgi:septum formation protein
MTAPPDGPHRLVLASGSPRRRDLLASLHLAFEVRPADVDETPDEGEAPAHLVTRLATAKASAVGDEGEVVVAADTIVSIDGTILGKPTDAADARRMLRLLSGRTHRVSTGVAVRVIDAGGAARQATALVVTDVTFADLADTEIAWYVADGGPLDKAGAYGMQDAGAGFVARIDGSPSNVIGLPLAETLALAARLDVDLTTFRHHPPPQT